MISVRDAFFSRIYELVCMGEDIVVVSCDLGAPSLDAFRRDYPERYVSVGIAEQNLIAVAAGLALSGKKVIAYGLNPFPITRAFDQIRTLMAELKIPITLCALNAGLCSAECGYTHMPVEDMGMMRMLSNIQIANPSDETISIKLAEETASCINPRYIRFDKSIGGSFYDRQEIDFQRGFSIYGEDSPVGVITNGEFVKQMRGMAQRYKKQGIGFQLIDIFSLPLREEELAATLRKYHQIVTLEENILAGGIGAMILEILSDHGLDIPVKRMGLDLRKGYYNAFTNREYIRKDQKLDDESIGSVISEVGQNEIQH